MSESKVSCQLRSLWPGLDVQAMEVILSSLLAHRGNGHPVWLVLCGRPAGGKTMMLDWLPTRSLPKAEDPVLKDGSLILLDSLTPKTLLSGLTGQARPGLLERVTDAVILVKDLAPLVNRSHGEGRHVFASLKRVFDGQVSAAWGSGKHTEWEGRVTLLAATPRDLVLLDSELGARMLTLRPCEMTFNASLATHTSSTFEDIRALMQDTLDRAPIPAVTTEHLNLVQAQAEALSILRAAVPRDSRHEVVELPVEEAPHRLRGQLASLLAGACALRDCAPEDTLDVINRVVINSVPPLRTCLLRALVQSDVPITQPTLLERAEELSEFSVPSALRWALDDLRVLRVVKLERLKGNSGRQGRPALVVDHGRRWEKVDGVTFHIYPVGAKQ